MTTLRELLARRPYPGRGCLAARTSSGDLVLAYFLTGRSEASRRRQIAGGPGGDFVVRDVAGGSSDPLRHYVAVARRGAWTVVGNGEQVVPLAQALAAGRDVLGAWSEHTFEPDGPIFTSRIWIAQRAGGPDCLVGFARRSDRAGGGADRVAWLAGELSPGSGVLMTTYAGTAAEIAATPAPVDVETASASPGALLGEVWDSLAPELRVAALALAPDRAELQPLVVQRGGGREPAPLPEGPAG